MIINKCEFQWIDLRVHGISAVEPMVVWIKHPNCRHFLADFPNQFCLCWGCGTWSTLMVDFPYLSQFTGRYLACSSSEKAERHLVQGSKPNRTNSEWRNRCVLCIHDMHMYYIHIISYCFSYPIKPPLFVAYSKHPRTISKISWIKLKVTNHSVAKFENQGPSQILPRFSPTLA